MKSEKNFKQLKKNFPNKKKFFYTIFFILIFFLILFFGLKNFEKQKNLEKNVEIEKILIWSIEKYKQINGKYPETLEKIENEKIINKINILKNKKNIFYKKIENNFNKNSSGFILKIF